MFIVYVYMHIFTLLFICILWLLAFSPFISFIFMFIVMFIFIFIFSAKVGDTTDTEKKAEKDEFAAFEDF